MNQSDFPYRECAKCETLTDCHNIEVANDGLGTPVVPEDCPKKELYDIRELNKRE